MTKIATKLDIKPFLKDLAILTRKHGIMIEGPCLLSSWATGRTLAKNLSFTDTKGYRAEKKS